MTAIVHAALAGLSHKSDKARKNFYKLKRVEERMQNMGVCGAFTYIAEGIIRGEHTFWLEGACKSTPWAFENLLLRSGVAIVIDAFVLPVLPFCGGYKIVEYCGEKREAKAQAQEKAQKEAAEKAAQVKAERELVQAKNIEIDQIGKFMDAVKSAKSMSVLTRSVDSRDKSAIVLGLVDAKNGQVCEFVTKDGDKVVVFNYSYTEGASAENDQVSAFLKTQAGNFQELATVKSELGMKEVKAEINKLNALRRRLVKPTNEQRQEMWHQIIQAHANDKVVG